MATVEGALTTWFLAQGSVSSLITDRIQPHIGTQSQTLPCVTYEFIASREEHNLAGKVDVATSRIQFTAWGRNFTEAMAVARALKNSGVDALKGTYSSVDIRGVQVVSGITSDEILIGDGEQAASSQQYRYFAEFELEVVYRES